MNSHQDLFAESHAILEARVSLYRTCAARCRLLATSTLSAVERATFSALAETWDRRANTAFASMTME